MENNTNPAPTTPPESTPPLESPTPAASSVQPTPATPPKKSKKRLLLIGILVILLLAAVAVGVWSYLNKNNTQTPQPAPVVSEAHETSHFIDMYYTNKTVIAIDAEGKKQELFKLDKEGLQPLKVIERESKPWLIYATGTKVSNTDNSFSDYKTIEMTNGTKTQVVTTFTNTNRASEVLNGVSPDGTKLAYYHIDADAISNPRIYTLDLKENSVPSAVLDPAKPDKHEVTVAGWSPDNNKIYLQQLSCRQCDGPKLPIIYSLDVAAKTATKVYTASLTGDVLAGAVTVLSSGKQAVVVASTNNYQGPSYQEVLNAKSEVYLVDLEKGAGEVLFKKTKPTDASIALLGRNPDTSALYFGVTMAEQVAGGEAVKTKFDRLVQYEIAKKSSTELTLSLSMLQKEGGSVVSANANGEHVMINTSSYTNDSSNYALQLLHLSKNENEVMPLINASTNGIVSLGFYKNMK